MAAATSPAAAGPAETSVSKADVLERHFLEGLRVAIRNLPSQSHGPRILLAVQLFEDAERDGSRNGSSAAPPRLLYLDTVAAPPQADRGAPPRPPAATLRTTVQTLWRIGAGQLNVKSANVRGLLRLEGDRQAFISNMAHLRPAFHALTAAVEEYRRIAPAQCEADGPSAPSTPTRPSPQRSVPSTPASSGWQTPIRSSATTPARLPEAGRWVLDDERSACVECNAEFTLFRRRHHCRGCGEIFCDECSRFNVAQQRMCQNCHRAMMNQIAQADEDVEGNTEPLEAAAETQAAAIDEIDEDIELDESLFVTDGPDAELSYMERQLLQHTRNEERKPVPATGPSQATADATVASSGTGLSATDSTAAAPILTVAPRRRCSVMMVLKVLLLAGLVLGMAGIALLSTPTPLNAANAIFTSSTLLNRATRLLHAVSDAPRYLTVESVQSLIWDFWATATWAMLLKPLAVLLILVACAVFLSRSMLRRQMRVYYTAVIVISSILWQRRQSRVRPRPPAEDDAVWEKLHARNARRVFEVACELRGFWVKVGQYLSSRGDVMPAPWVQELSKMQDAMPPQPLEQVRRTLEEDLSQPLEMIFSQFDPEPLASASIAQVHKAVLRHNNTAVAVKVQHRNIQRIMRQDLHDLFVIVKFIAFLEPEYNFMPVLAEWSKVAERELDFLNEAANSERVRRNMLEANLDVIVPRIHSEYVTSHVIVMDFVEGFKVTDMAQLEAHGVDRNALMRRICQAFAHQVYLNGFFNCDPHPGNILVQIKDGQAWPVLLDYGMCRELADDKRLAFSRMIYASSIMDFGSLLGSFDDMGLKLKRLDPAEDMKNIRFLLSETAPGDEMRRQFKEFREEAWQKRQQLPRSQRNPVEAWPPELLFFFRVTLLLRGLCAVLGVRVRYSAILAPYARLALLRSYPRTIVARQPFPPPNPLARTPAVPLTLTQKLQRAVARLYSRDAVTGIQVAVYHQGQLATEVCAGVMGEADPRPVRPDSLFNCFSVTKGIVSMVAHLLAEQNLIDYDAPMARYWPEFAAAGKANTTVRHVLAHQTGLHREPSLDVQLKQLCDWEAMLARLAAAEPVSPPGRLTRYHVLSYGWLIGGLVRGALKGQHLRNVFQALLAGPLGIADEAMLGMGDCDFDKLQSRLTTLCNGLFTSSDGSLPEESEIQQLLTRLREHDTQRRQEELRANQEAAGGSGSVAAAVINGNGTTTSAAAPVPPRTTSEASVTTSPADDSSESSVSEAPSAETADLDRTVPIDSTVKDDEIQYPPSLLKKKTLYDVMLCRKRAELVEAARMGEDAGWTKASETRGVAIYKREVPGSPVVMVRGKGRIESHPACVFELLADHNNKRKWNAQFKQLDIIEAFDQRLRLMRDEYEPIWPVQGRDFSIVQEIHFMESGGLVVTSYSVVEPRIPEKPGLVRAELLLGGAIIEPAPDNPMHSDVTYIVCADLKGSIPKPVKNVVAVRQPLCVDGIRQMCKTVPTDIERYRKMQRYMERRQALRRSAGEVPRSLPTFDPAAASAAEVGSPSTLDGEDQQLAVAAAAGASIPAAETANGSGAAAAGTSAPVQMDTSKLLLIDPCVYNLKEVREACIPSANGHFTARALARLYAVLANDGELEGRRYFNKGRVATMAQLQSQDTLVMGVRDMRWGMGFQKFSRTDADGVERPDSIIGHFGLGGSAALCDIEANLSVAVTVNRLSLDSQEVCRCIMGVITDHFKLGHFHTGRTDTVAEDDAGFSM